MATSTRTTESPTIIGQRPVVNEVFSLAYRFRARRTNFSLRAVDSTQTRQLDGGGAEFLNVSAIASRRLGRSLTLQASATYLENRGTLDAGTEFVTQGRESWRGTLQLRRRLANRANVFLRYEYVEQTGVRSADLLGDNSFDEHRLVLGLQFSFGDRVGGGGFGGQGGVGGGGGGFGGGGRGGSGGWFR